MSLDLPVDEATDLNTDGTDTGTIPGGGFDLGGWLSGLFGGLFGGGTSGPRSIPAFDPNTMAVGRTTKVPGGTQVLYNYGTAEAPQWATHFEPDQGGGRSAGQAAAQAGFYRYDPASNRYVPDTEAYVVAQQAKQNPSGYKSLQAAAAGAGFYNPDGTPDTAGYLAARQAQVAKATAGRAGPAMPTLARAAASAGFFNPDGSIDTQGYLAHSASQRSLTPPSLEPGRPQIVRYLQALLGQNALPYTGISTGADRAPAVAPPAIAPAPAVTPPASPGAIFPPPAAAAPGLPALGLPGGAPPGLPVPEQLDIGGPLFRSLPSDRSAALPPLGR